MAVLRVNVVAGAGKWAYWHSKPASVVADDVCQPRAAHFAGMLAQPVLAAPCKDAELHTEGFIEERPKSIWARESEAYDDY